jgi:hypothetical protein
MTSDAAPELAAAMRETRTVLAGYQELCGEFSPSPQSGWSARISLTVLNRHRLRAGLPELPRARGEDREDVTMRYRRERDEARATARLYQECEAGLQEVHAALVAAYGRDDLTEGAEALLVGALASERDEARAERDKAYRERAALVAFLAACYPSVIISDAHDPDWPVIYVQAPSGQMSWHLTRADAGLFPHVEARDAEMNEALPAGPWDGHTTEVKYERLAALTATLARAGGGAIPAIAVESAIRGHDADQLRSALYEIIRVTGDTVVIALASKALGAGEPPGEAGERPRWQHRECGGTVTWDISGGTCGTCHAEGLGPLAAHPGQAG